MGSVRVERFISDVDRGLHDAGIFRMETAVKQRASALRARRTTDDYSKGDRVVVNDRSFYKELQGCRGTVVQIEKYYVQVLIEKDGEKRRYLFAPGVIDKEVY